MYDIKQDGSIVSHKTGKPIYEYVNPKGYHFVRLVIEGKKKTVLKHRVIANKFLPNPLRLPEVNHIDGDKSNNAVSNLEWCSRKHNVEHAVKTGLHHRGCSQGLTTLVPEQTARCAGCIKQVLTVPKLADVLIGHRVLCIESAIIKLTKMSNRNVQRLSRNGVGASAPKRSGANRHMI